MGDMADYYRAQQMEQEWKEIFEEEHQYMAAQYMKEEYDKGILQWTTREGNRININAMDNDHLRNTYRMLGGKSKKTLITYTWINIFATELRLRGLIN